MLREGVHAVTGSWNGTCSLYEWYRVAFIPLAVSFYSSSRRALHRSAPFGAWLPSLIRIFMLTRQTDFTDFSPPAREFDSNSIRVVVEDGTCLSLKRRETSSGSEDLSPFDSLINNVLNSSFQGLLQTLGSCHVILAWERFAVRSIFVPSLVAFSSKRHLVSNLNVIVQTRIGRSFKGTADSYTALLTVPLVSFISLQWIYPCKETLILYSRRTGSDERCFFQLLFVEIRRWQRAATPFERNNSHCPSLPGRFFSGTTTIGASSPTTSRVTASDTSPRPIHWNYCRAFIGITSSQSSLSYHDDPR